MDVQMAQVFLILNGGDGLCGRISVRLFKDAPVGATRFAGKQGGLNC